MKEFISGKTNKVVAIFLIMLLPRIITSLLLDYDYGLGAIIGVALTIPFMIYTDKTAVEKIKRNCKKTKVTVVMLVILMIFSVQFLLFFISAKVSELSPNPEWLTYANIISPILIAPVAEEVLFRWALTETCINEQTTKFKKGLFLFLMLIIWNFLHTKSLTSINIDVLLLGLLFYIIYFNSGNLLYCIVAHISANLFFVIASSPLQSYLIDFCKNNIVLVIDIIVLVLSSFWVLKNLRLQNYRIND